MLQIAGVTWMSCSFWSLHLGGKMDAKPVDSSSQSPSTSSEDKPTVPSVSRTENPSFELPSFLSASSISSWTQKLKLPQPVASSQDSSQSPNSGIVKLSRFANGMGFRLPAGTPTTNEAVQGTSENAQSGVLGSVAKGLLDSSRNAVKAVQVKARHVVSQNKRRYQVRWICSVDHFKIILAL